MINQIHDAFLKAGDAVVAVKEPWSVSPRFVEQRVGVPLKTAIQVVDMLSRARILKAKGAGGPYEAALTAAQWRALREQYDDDVDALISGQSQDVAAVQAAELAEVTEPTNPAPVTEATTPSDLARAAVTGVRTLELSLIKEDSEIQLRDGLNDKIVEEYAEEMAGGTSLPPILVYEIDGQYHVADGFHRIAAARKLGKEKIEAEVRAGSKGDARCAAIHANSHHGLPLTAEERRAAVGRLLQDPETKKLSSNELARRLGISNRTIGRIRDVVEGDQPTKERTYKKADGQTGVMKTGGIGKNKEASQKSATPKKGATGGTSPVDQSSPEEVESTHAQATPGSMLRDLQNMVTALCDPAQLQKALQDHSGDLDRRALAGQLRTLAELLGKSGRTSAAIAMPQEPVSQSEPSAAGPAVPPVPPTPSEGKPKGRKSAKREVATA